MGILFISVRPQQLFQFYYEQWPFAFRSVLVCRINWIASTIPLKSLHRLCCIVSSSPFSHPILGSVLLILAFPHFQNTIVSARGTFLLPPCPINAHEPFRCCLDKPFPEKPFLVSQAGHLCQCASSGLILPAKGKVPSGSAHHSLSEETETPMDGYMDGYFLL